MLDALTGALVDDLRAVLPDGWKVRDAAEQHARALGVVLYYEQGDIITTIGNTPVPVNHIGVEYTLTLAAPEEDPLKGRQRVTSALLHLLPALDAMPFLVWDSAERIILNTGENCYRLGTVHLSRYATTTPTTDPAPEPPTMPEEA